MAAAATTALPLPPAPPPPPPLPMPEVEPLPELTVLREFWLPCGVRFPISSVRLGAWVLLWWEDAGDGGTSPSALTGDDRRGLGEREAGALCRVGEETEWRKIYGMDKWRQVLGWSGETKHRQHMTGEDEGEN